MGLHIQHASRRSESTLEGASVDITYEGTRAEVEEYAATHVAGVYVPELGRITSRTVHQVAGPLWAVDVSFAADPGGLDAVTGPNTDWEKKNAELTTGRLPLPLEKCGGYLANWNHYLACAPDVSTSPAWWLTATSTVLTAEQAEQYAWLDSLAALPSGWHIITEPTKLGTQTWDRSTYQVTESARFKNAKRAGAMVRNKLDKIGSPEEDFGLGGEWKCDAATVSWQGNYWVARLVWTRGEGPDGWDDDMYDHV